MSHVVRTVGIIVKCIAMLVAISMGWYILYVSMVQATLVITWFQSFVDGMVAMASWLMSFTLAAKTLELTGPLMSYYLAASHPIVAPAVPAVIAATPAGGVIAGSISFFVGALTCFKSYSSNTAVVAL